MSATCEEIKNFNLACHAYGLKPSDLNRKVEDDDGFVMTIKGFCFSEIFPRVVVEDEQGKSFRLPPSLIIDWINYDENKKVA